MADAGEAGIDVKRCLGMWRDLKASFGAGAHAHASFQSAEPLLDVEQHEHAGDNDDIQEQPDNGDRAAGITLFGRRVLRQRR